MNKRLFWVVLAVIVVTGCTKGVVETPKLSDFPEFLDESEKQAERSKERIASFPARDKAIQLPKDALWLGDVRVTHFKQAPARVLIEALAAPHPVIFNVQKDDNPIVYAPPNAQRLIEYLDSFAVQANWSYSVNSGVLIIADWESKVIEIEALVGKASATLKSASGVGIQDQQNELVVETDPYTEIEELVAGVFAGTATSVAAQLGSSGQREPTFRLSRAANLLYVSATPNQVQEVFDVIGRYNDSSSKRVIINITVYDVSLIGEDKRSLNLDLLRAATNTTRIIGGSLDTLRITRSNNPDVRSRSDTIVAQWIESQGVVSNKIQRRFETLNNRTVTFLDTREVSFVKSISTGNQTTNGVTSNNTQVNIGNHLLGRSFNLFATIIKERVSLQIQINNRTVAKETIYDVGVAGSGVLYDIDNVDRVIPLSLQNGETRVITYFNDDTTDVDHGRNKLLPIIGNRVDDQSERSETVIVISADIVS